MIDTTDLDSYYPGYEDYCEPKKEDELDSIIDEIIDEIKLEKFMKEKESEENGLH